MKSQNVILFFILILQLFSASLEDESYKFAIELKETFDEYRAVKDEEEVDFDDSITAKQIMDEMGFGWNLGNSLDAWKGNEQDQGLESETLWGNTRTTEEVIIGLVKKGIKTIRIPVTWHNHLIDENYTIDPEWMERVKIIVNWSIKHGLYVILNTHHDNSETSNIRYGQGYYPLREDKVESEKFLYNVFRQISLAFNNGYDHHLIFECLNEPRLIGTPFEWNYAKGEPICEEASSAINEYLKLIVKAIRTSGGNNEKRFIMVTPYAAKYNSLINQDFIIPGDIEFNPSNSKILLSLHMYNPYDFVMNPDKSYITFEETYANELYSSFKNLYESYVLRGHNVVIGEMGIVNKNNTEERIKWARYYVSTARKYNLPCIVWDNELFNSAGENFGIYKRDEGEWSPEVLIDAYVKASKTPMEENPIDYVRNNFLSNPYEFNNWKQSFEVGIGILSSYNSRCKLILETEEPSYFPDYRMFNLHFADWSTTVDITQDEVKGGKTNGLGGINLEKGKNYIEIAFNEQNIELVKQKGLYIIGHGFTLTRISIEGPKLISLEPTKILRSKTEEQKVTLLFSEDATDLVGNIKFINRYYNLNRKLACVGNHENKKVIYCEGLYDFSGQYQIVDDKGYLLTNKIISVLPKRGEQYDISNFLSEKFLFDVSTFNGGVRIPSLDFADVEEHSTLVLETTDLFVETSQRILFILKGNTDSVIKFDQKEVSVEIFEDGGMIIPRGNNLIRISLEKKTDLVMKNGISLIGYGFGLKTVYLE